MEILSKRKYISQSVTMQKQVRDCIFWRPNMCELVCKYFAFAVHIAFFFVVVPKNAFGKVFIIMALPLIILKLNTPGEFFAFLVVIMIRKFDTFMFYYSSNCSHLRNAAVNMCQS